MPRIFITLRNGQTDVIQLPDQFTLSEFLNTVRNCVGFDVRDHVVLVDGQPINIRNYEEFNQRKHLLYDGVRVSFFQELNHGSAVDVMLTVNGVVFYPYNYPLQNRNRPPITVSTTHMSCRSDIYRPEVNLVGFIIYSYNNQFEFRFPGMFCKSGYMLIKEMDSIRHVVSDQPVVHASLFKWFSGTEIDEKFVGVGFSHVHGQWKFNSYNMAITNDVYHADKYTMHPIEIDMISAIIVKQYETHQWTRNPNASVVDLMTSIKSYISQIGHGKSCPGNCNGCLTVLKPMQDQFYMNGR